MKRLMIAAALCVASLVSFATHAITLEPLPGSTPQQTCFSCVFPNPVGVIARGDSGQPLAGVAVTFTTQSSTLGMVHFDDFCCVAFDQVVVTTGTDGVAIGTVVTIDHPDASGTVTASADGAADISFALSTSTQHASTLAVVSGDEQFAQAGTTFAGPWKVRVLDDAGQPVPYAMITFYGGAFGNPTQPTANFGGSDWANAVADENGIATSPPATAGPVAGDGFIDAAMKTGLDGEAAPSVDFAYHVVSFPLTTSRATLVSAPPDSLQNGTLAAAPYVMRLVDSQGKPVAGMPVSFAAGQDCGAFAGATQETVLSDSNGLAKSALLESTGLGSCNILITAGGLPNGLSTSMYMFDPNNVTVTPRNPWVISKARGTYLVTVYFADGGRPIQPASLQAVNVLRDHAPPAGIASPPAIAIVNGSATLTVHANNVPGTYDLEIVFWGPSRTLVHVLQLP
jgi:hypothetical protein